MHCPRLAILLAFVSVLLAGCGGEESDPSINTKDPAPLSHPFTLHLGDVAFTAEIAIATSEQARGLMHRESLPADHGMLFLYKEPQQMTFWMKNTLIPLDIGFIGADGTLLQIARMYPRDLESTPSTSDEVQFALEMAQGWFRSKGIVPGAKLDLAEVRAAVAARGTDPKPYGLK